MANNVSNLPRTEYSGLTFDNLIVDIKNKIKENPDYNQNWDDFMSANAGRMILELFSYIVEQLGIRLDVIVNEFFLPTAQQDDSIINLIKLISYQPQLANAAQVDVKCVTDNTYTKNIIMPFPFVLEPEDLNGTTSRFELIKKTAGGKFEYNYDSTATGHITEFSIDNYNPKVDVLTFYKGTTISQTYTASGIENELIELNTTNILKDSIRIYKIIINNDSSISYKEALEVTSFLDPDAQEKTAFLPYKLELLTDKTYGIRFSDNTMMINKEEYTLITSDNDFSTWEEKLPIESDVYSIFYRIDGGENANIAPRSINETRSFYDENNGTSITMTFLNLKSGYYGTDAETIEQARINAPEFIAAVGKAVTAKDHKALAKAIPLNLKSVHYGQQNKPNTLYNLYGYDLNPVEVWHYIVPNITGWQTKDTWEYSDAFRFTSKETMYMNDPLTFSTGETNIQASLGTSKSEEDLTNNGLGLEVYNIIIPPTVINGFAVAGATLVYTHNASGGTATLANAAFLTTAVNYSLYEFVYTISSSSNTTTQTAKINAGFALEDVVLETNDGVAHSIIFRASTTASTSDFVISAISAAADTFTMSAISLKEYKNLYRKIAVLSETESRKFIDFTAGTPELFSLGTNNAMTINTEGNEENWEEINIKLTKSTIGSTITRFDNTGSLGITSVYTYKNADYTSWLRAENKTFVLELIDEKFLQITVQDDEIIAPNEVYVHYIKPEGYYGTDTIGNPYRYIYLSDYPLYPNLYDEPYEIKLTQTKTDERDLILLTGEFTEDTHYIVENSIQKQQYKISTELIDATSTISDFDSFSAHYKVDKRGSNIEIYTNAFISNNLLNFIDSDDFSINMTIKVGDTEVSNDMTSLKFYDTISTGIAEAGTTTTSIVNATGGFASSCTNFYVKANNQYRKIIIVSVPNTITFSNLVGLTVGDTYEIVSAPTAASIVEKFNDTFGNSGNDELIRNYLNAYYDSETDQIAFIVRGVPFLEGNKTNSVTLTISNMTTGTSMSSSSYLSFVSGVNATTDEDSDGVSDVYATTHEFIVNNEFEDARMTSHEYLYKQPIFKTFDVWMNVYYFNKYNPTSIESLIKTKIKNEFSLISVDFGNTIHRSEVSGLAYDVDGVNKIDVIYFGEDYINTADAGNSIETEFDEILIVSSDRYEENFTETKTNQINGININMIKVI